MDTLAGQARKRLPFSFVSTSGATQGVNNLASHTIMGKKVLHNLQAPTIAQATANVEERVRKQKLNGTRQRLPRATAMQKAIVAEARRLEMDHVARTMGYDNIGDMMMERNVITNREAAAVARRAKSDYNGEPFKPEWTPKPRDPNLHDVHRAAIGLQRSALKLERECVALQMMVQRMLNR